MMMSINWIQDIEIMMGIIKIATPIAASVATGGAAGTVASVAAVNNIVSAVVVAAMPQLSPAEQSADPATAHAVSQLPLIISAVQAAQAPA
jgi:hypothetical protein